MEIMIVTVLAALAFSPLLLAYRRHQSGRSPKGAMAVNIVAVFALCLLTTGMGIGGHAMAAAEQGAAAASSSAGRGFGGQFGHRRHFGKRQGFRQGPDFCGSGRGHRHLRYAGVHPDYVAPVIEGRKNAVFFDRG